MKATRHPSAATLFAFLWSLPAVAFSQAFRPFDPTRMDVEIAEDSRIMTAPNGLRYLTSPDLLPPPADPNDFLTSPLWDVTSLGRGVGLLERGNDTIFSRLGGQANLNVFYDTGDIGRADTFQPAQIALSGSDESHQNGQTTMTATDGKLQFDNQVLDFLGLGRGQLYTELDFAQDTFTLDREVRVPHLFFRLATAEGPRRAGTSLETGLLETLFGDVASVPISIINNTMPVGSVNAEDRQNVTQVRLSKAWEGGLSVTLGVEKPDHGDVVAPDSAVLDRWPRFTGRVRYVGENNWDSYQVAALLRPLVVENADFSEAYATGWGLSAMARKRNWAQTNDVYVGVVGGQGIGDYLNGLATAAVQDADGFRALTEIGAYTGLAHLWLTDEKSHPKLWSNAAYGYLFTDTAATTDSPTERMQQAWANVIWQVNMNWALGLEYHFGMREVADGREGENHRIQFVMKFGTAGSDERAYSDSTAHLHRL